MTTGYSYREVPTENQPDLVSPERVHQPSGVRGSRRRDLRSTEGQFQPVAEALIGVARQELDELKKYADEQQAVEGAIRAGKEEGMDTIRKRGSAMDWVFGTRAKEVQAAAVHSSVAVTDWTAEKIQKLPDQQDMSNEDYAEEIRNEILFAADQIDDPDLRKAFVDQASQRAQQLTAIHLAQHDKYVQEKANQAYQADLKSRVALINAMEKTDGAYDQAVADLVTLFTTKPDGMTEKAHQTAIAQVIIQAAHEGDRSIYDFADAQGILDELPEQLRSELEEAYKRAAPINNPELINDLESYGRDILNPNISMAEFERRQMEMVAKWDGIHHISDSQLANDRIRHQKALEAAADDAADNSELLAYYLQNDAFALAAAKPSDVQEVATEAILQGFAGLPGLSQEFLNVYNEADNSGKSSLMVNQLFQMMQSGDPSLEKKATDFMTSSLSHAADVGFKVNYLGKVFEAVTRSPIQMDANGNSRVNPQAQVGMEMMATLMRNGDEHFLNLMVDTETLARAYTYQDLVDVQGYTPEGALNQIHLNAQKPETDRRIPKDKHLKHLDDSMETFEKVMKGKNIWQRFWSDDPMNLDEARDNIEAIARGLLVSGGAYDGAGAYKAAASMYASQNEMVGNTIVFKGSQQSLMDMIGINVDVEDAITDYVTTSSQLEGTEVATKRGKLDWDKNIVSIDVATRRITVTPIIDAKGNPSGTSSSVVIPFSSLRQHLGN